MNKQLIEKIISANEPCPKFSYGNPLLDKNVAKALSRSFVKILKLTKQNTNINNNMRISVLEYIRRLCRTGPKNHINLDENVTKLIVEFYNEYVSSAPQEDFQYVDKNLDEFLVREMSQIKLNSTYEPKLNYETAQALINLDENGETLPKLIRDVVHWNHQDNKHQTVLNGLWNNDHLFSTTHEDNIFDDISVKQKEEIERTLLEVCIKCLTNKDTNIESVFSSNDLFQRLLKVCSVSAKCFQMCCLILNNVFIETKFHSSILSVITKFVYSVKKKCNGLSFSTLYNSNLSNLVVLLDLDLADLPKDLQEQYTSKVIQEIKCIQELSEHNLILILSHFPQWLDIYFQ